MSDIKRLTQFDYARGMAIIAVLVIHTVMYGSLASGNGPLRISLSVIDLLVAFAVPLFVFISGYLLSISCEKGFDLKAFYRKRASSVLVPYVLFASLYLMMLRAYGKEITPEGAVSSIVTGTGLYQLYFVILIAQLYVMFPILMWIVRKANGRVSIAVVLISAVLIGFTSTLLGAVFGAGDHNILNDSADWVYFLTMPGILFYFVLGMVVARRPAITAVKGYGRSKAGASVLAMALLSLLLLSGSGRGRPGPCGLCVSPDRLLCSGHIPVHVRFLVARQRAREPVQHRHPQPRGILLHDIPDLHDGEPGPYQDHGGIRDRI